MRNYLLYRIYRSARSACSAESPSQKCICAASALRLHLWKHIHIKWTIWPADLAIMMLGAACSTCFCHAWALQAKLQCATLVQVAVYCTSTHPVFEGPRVTSTIDLTMSDLKMMMSMYCCCACYHRKKLHDVLHEHCPEILQDRFTRPPPFRSPSAELQVRLLPLGEDNVSIQSASVFQGL